MWENICHPSLILLGNNFVPLPCSLCGSSAAQPVGTKNSCHTQPNLIRQEMILLPEWWEKERAKQEMVIENWRGVLKEKFILIKREIYSYKVKEPKAVVDFPTRLANVSLCVHWLAPDKRNKPFKAALTTVKLLIELPRLLTTVFMLS